MHTITKVEVMDDFRLGLRFDDGTAGEVDLSNLAGHGVFAAWTDFAEFQKVKVGEVGELVWPCGVDLCPDALYLSVTGKRPEEEFPILKHELANA